MYVFQGVEVLKDSSRTTTETHSHSLAYVKLNKNVVFHLTGAILAINRNLILGEKAKIEFLQIGFSSINAESYSQPAGPTALPPHGPTLMLLTISLDYPDLAKLLTCL